MRHDQSFGDRMGGDPSYFQQPGSTLRLASQVIGLILVLAGAWYALSIIAAGIKVARDPSEIEPDLVAMARTLKLEGATVPMGEGEIAVDRTVAVVALLLWYLLTAFISLLLISGGGRLVLGVVSERREFLAAMKEFLATMRQQGSEHKQSG